jgi:hypothetical protein
MSAKVGFLITSYDKPTQLLWLVRRLKKIYDDPPNFCNHDFNKCSL